jgi:hypothetical protein
LEDDSRDSLHFAEQDVLLQHRAKPMLELRSSICSLVFQGLASLVKKVLLLGNKYNDFLFQPTAMVD